MSQLSENKIRTQPPTLEEFGLDASIYEDYHGKKNELEKIKKENDEKIKEIRSKPVFRILSRIAFFIAALIFAFFILMCFSPHNSSDNNLIALILLVSCGCSLIGSGLHPYTDVFYLNLFSSGQYKQVIKEIEEIENQIWQLTKSIKDKVSPYEEAFNLYYKNQLDDFYAANLFRKRSKNAQFEYSLSKFELMIEELSAKTSNFVTKPISLVDYEIYAHDRRFNLEHADLFKPQEQNIKEVIPPEKIYRTARKIDNWEEINKKRKITGLKGEEIAVVVEQEYLESINRKDLSDKVRHVSLEDGDGLGYDVLSFFEDGREKYIEVKSTTTSFDTPFYLSRNEFGFLNEHNEDYFLYRILITGDTPQFKVYSSSEVLEMNEIVPIQYLVRTK